MLIKISVDNFKSFDKPTELTMVSSNKIRSNPEHRIKIKSTQMLKHAVVYGANASGKTNLIDFFWFFKFCVEKGLPVESMRMFCRNKEENEKRESSFEIQFSVNDTFYAYGFSAILSQRKITGEWLYELYQNGTAKRIFEREGSNHPVLDESIHLPESDARKFQTYADDFAGNTSSLFLTEMNRNKKFAKGSKLLVFRTVFDWIRKNLIVLTPNAPITNFSYYYESESLALVNNLIKTFDTGITNVRIEETTLEELSTKLPRPLFDNIMSQMKSKIEESDNSVYRMSMRIQDSFYNIEFTGEQEPRITTLRLRHGKSFFDFNFEDESDGTRRLFDLLDMLLIKNEDVVFVVDELERSLHPKLTQHFLELFTKMHIDKRIQLVFTTHESSIMDQSLFRRDEIWFVERDAANSSTIYSLDRFKERYDKVLSKAYLDGRYGAIPVFSSFDFTEEE